MAVRHLHQEFFEFTPEFKLLLSANNRPWVRGQDEGVWRRIRIGPFEVTIPEEERDRRLLEWSQGSDNPIRADDSGILNWMLDGFEQWAEGGLQAPDAVIAATQDYRSEQDPVRQFLEAACSRKQGSRIQSVWLYGAYKKWCAENALDLISHTAFGRTLTDLGLKKETEGKVFYIDLALLPEYEPSAETVPTA